MRATLADFKCFGVVHKFAKLIVVRTLKIDDEIF